MASMSCTFDAIPRSITSAGSVRFFPFVTLVTSPVVPIVSYDWDFGDGTAHGTDATPIHTYPVVAAYTTYDVTLTVTDAAGTSANLTINDFIASDAAANVPAFPTDGTYFPISVLMYDIGNQMLLNRNAWGVCSLYLLNPVITTSIDKIGTMKFSILDIGNSTVNEQSLIAEGVTVIAIVGYSVVFSGLIRRVTQNTQDGFTSSSKVRKWDIECDSDLARLKKLKVDSTALPEQGQIIIDSPGNISKRILT